MCIATIFDFKNIWRFSFQSSSNWMKKLWLANWGMWEDGAIWMHLTFQYPSHLIARQPKCHKYLVAQYRPYFHDPDWKGTCKYLISFVRIFACMCNRFVDENIVKGIFPKCVLLPSCGCQGVEWDAKLCNLCLVWNTRLNTIGWISSQLAQTTNSWYWKFRMSPQFTVPS